MSFDSVVFGRLVTAGRDERGWSQDDLAQRVKVSRGQISRIESGAKGPSYGTMLAIAVELDIDLNLLKVADTPSVGSPIDPAEPTRLPEDEPTELLNPPSAA